jgi:hypothetical protein
MNSCARLQITPELFLQMLRSGTAGYAVVANPLPEGARLVDIALGPAAGPDGPLIELVLCGPGLRGTPAGLGTLPLLDPPVLRKAGDRAPAAEAIS